MHFQPDSFPILSDAKTLSKDFPVMHLTHVQKYQPNNNLHYHNCLEIGFVVDGNGTEMINNQLYSFDINSISIIPKECIHDSHIFRHSNGDSESIWQFIFVDLDALGITCDNFAGFLSNDSRLATLFHYMFVELESQPNGYQEVFTNLLSSFLIYANRLAPDTSIIRTELLPPDMSYLIQRIHTSYAEDLTVEQLAKECNMSISTFCRAFKQHFSKSPYAYLISMRLTIVQHLLQTTDLSILEISSTAGFNSLSSLNRLFKKEFGVSPRTMRQNYQKRLQEQKGYPF